MTPVFFILFIPAVLFIVLPILGKLLHKPKTASKTHTPQSQAAAYAAQNVRDIVLIGSLSSDSQLSVCLEHNFYHIPASIAGNDYQNISYVAIYQSRRFFGAAAGVRYYARVKSACILPRHEIAEIPRQSSMPYVRFDLEPWQLLPVPIIPHGKGITSARSTLDRLLTSKNMSQLLKR